LGIPIEVVRGRAEEPDVRQRFGGADVVTARAVAPMERLVGWCLPLLRRGGRMLALKGDAAADELAAVAPDLAKLGAQAWSVVEVGEGLGNAATRVIRIDLGPQGFKTPRVARRSAFLWLVRPVRRSQAWRRRNAG